MGPIGCPETSATNYNYSLRNSPEEHSSLSVCGSVPNYTFLKDFYKFSFLKLSCENSFVLRGSSMGGLPLQKKERERERGREKFVS
jgi:hypothetical protein